MLFRTTTLSAVLALAATGALGQAVTPTPPAAVTQGTVAQATPPAEATAVAPAAATEQTFTVPVTTPAAAAPAATATPPAAAPAADATATATAPAATAEAPAATVDPIAPATAEVPQAEGTAAPADAQTAVSPEGVGAPAAALPDATTDPVATPAAEAPAAEATPAADTAPVADAAEVGAVTENPEVATQTDPAAAEGPATADPAAADGQVADAPAAQAVHQEITDVAFPHEGPFGRYDQFQLQRGLQVYTEVCAGCHGLRYVPIRTLHDAGGPGLPEDQVRAYAAAMTIVDAETGEERPRLPTDHFPRVAGDGMGPDLSLMAKSRAGFHGPYGTGISQFFNGMGGPEYIYSILTHYTGETKDEAGTTYYENTAFPGGWIAMPPPLNDDQVTYADGHAATVSDMSKDVASFLMWTAEPKMMDRKQVGLVAVLFLIVLTALLYLTNKKLWWPIKHRDETH